MRGALQVWIMSVVNELNYVANLARVLGVSRSDVERHLMEKPFGDTGRTRFLCDIGQILSFLPAPPSRVLDLGCGSGWTSEIIARCGYNVTGLDVSPDMIELARRRESASLGLCFKVHDWLTPYGEAGFDAALAYDSLHHALDEGLVVRNAHDCLKDGGVLVTIEPGQGHSQTPDTLDVITKFGTTEKDMPFVRQEEILLSAGFREVRQYLRLSQLALHDLAVPGGVRLQIDHFSELIGATRNGLTSVVVALK